MRFCVSLLCLSALGWLLSCSGSTEPGNGHEAAALVVQIGDVEARPGDVVVVPITLALNPDSPNHVDSLSSFNLLISYRYDVLQLLNVTPGEGDSLWEHFTYRRDGKLNSEFKRDAVRIIAFRDADDGVAPSSTQAFPAGEIARLVFEVNPRPEFAGDSVEIGFQSLECEDNTLADGADHALLHFMREYESADSLSAPNDTLRCPRRFPVSSDAQFHAGLVRIGATSDDTPPQPGDLNLDGVSSDVVDVVMFIGEFLRREHGFSEDPAIRARQIVASDVNRDGMPGRIADFEMLHRTAFRDYDVYQPYERTSGSAGLFRLISGVQIVPPVPMSMTYLEIWLPQAETSGLHVDVRPEPREFAWGLQGDTLRLWLDHRNGPVTGDFGGLFIYLSPAPQNGYEIVDVHLSTPPGIEIPVTGFDPP